MREAKYHCPSACATWREISQGFSLAASVLFTQLGRTSKCSLHPPRPRQGPESKRKLRFLTPGSWSENEGSGLEDETPHRPEPGVLRDGQKGAPSPLPSAPSFSPFPMGH